MNFFLLHLKIFSFQEINEDIETRNRVSRNCTDISELTCEIPVDHAVNKGKVNHFKLYMIYRFRNDLF